MGNRQKHSSSRDVSVISESENKAELLLQLVRRLALDQQGDAPQNFISLREASNRFGVSLSTMAKVYRRLKSEGLIISVRGAKTILAGRRSTRQLTVRGVIGVPVSLANFLAQPEYRMAILQMRAELLLHGFATNELYFQAPLDVAAGFLSARFSRASVDTVLWLLPNASVSEVSLRLQDLGMQLVSVTDRPTPFASRYRVRRVDALKAILRHWRSEAKLTMVKIVLAGGTTPADDGLQALVEAEHFNCKVVRVSDKTAHTLPKTLHHDGGTGVILGGPAASMLCRRAPEVVLGVLEEFRVALADGPIDMPRPDISSNILVDLVTVNWQAVAQRIVADLISGDGIDRGEGILFEAEPHLRIALCGDLQIYPSGALSGGLP